MGGNWLTRRSKELSREERQMKKIRAGGAGNDKQLAIFKKRNAELAAAKKLREQQ